MEGTNIMANLRFNLVLLGGTGAEKSASGNTILGRQAFPSQKRSTSVRQGFAAENGEVCGLPVTVYDTPGFSGTKSEEEIQKYEEVLQKCESGLYAFLIVLQPGRFTEDDEETLEKIEDLLGEKRIKNTWILFTDEENKTINEFINENETLKNLIQKCEGRFHVINNKKQTRDQVQPLISKVLQRNLENLPKKSRQRISINTQDVPVESRLSRRIVLLGKSGVGKSASGNTILGQKDFKSMRSARSVTSECLEKHATVSDRPVSVVDTPGFFDTHMNPEELVMEIAKSVYISSPGPHAFLIVLRVIDRFTEHELQIPQMIEMMFGEEVLKYSIILFTHGDLIEGESVEELIQENSKLRDLVQQCGGRFHVFNNKDENNRKQVNDLLKKIDSMIEQNGGGHYSNEMFEDAQRFRQEEEEQGQRGEEERKRQEKKEIQEEIDRVRKETEERIRAEYEAKFERFKAESEEEQRKRDKQRKEEIEREMKDAERRIRAEKKGGFFNFISKHKRFFTMAAFVLAGMLVGAVVLAGVGAAVGAGVAAFSVGGGTLSTSLLGASLSFSTAAVASAGAGAVGTGAAAGALYGAAAGAVLGAAGGAVIGVAATEDDR